MMRWMGAPVLCFVHAIGAGAAGGPAIVEGQPGCTAATTGGDHRRIECPLNGTGASQRFRFIARFSGGHDDTSARLAATLDGLPLACDPGSKTSLFGEDGDVALECRFSIAGQTGTRHLFAVTLVWSHAQYTDFELIRS